MLQSITLTAEFDELPKLAAWVEAQAPQFALDARQLYAIQLCVEEVAANLVMHARRAGQGAAHFTVALEADPLRVTVEDDGPAFDPTKAPLPKGPATLESVGSGGLGLELVSGFASLRDYARVAGKNRLTLGFG